MNCRNHPDVLEGVRPCSRCGGAFCPDCLVDIRGRAYCVNCKGEQLLDIKSGVDRTVLPYAPVLKRLAAYLVDYAIITFISWVVIIPVMLGAGFYTSIFRGEEPSPWILLVYIPALTIPIAYEALAMYWKPGQTLGKFALKLQVVRPDGSPISRGQMWGRAALRLVFGCLIIADYIPVFFTEEKTTLHDMVAKTRVIEVY